MQQVNAFTTLKQVKAESERVKEELRRRSLEDQLKEAISKDKKPS